MEDTQYRAWGFGSDRNEWGVTRRFMPRDGRLAARNGGAAKDGRRLSFPGIRPPAVGRWPHSGVCSRWITNIAS